MALDPKREIYASAPLLYVACELRFPYSPRLTTDEAAAALLDQMRPQFPILEPVTETSVVLGPLGRVAAPSEVKKLRFNARSRQLAAVIGPTDLLVETTDYVRFEDYAERVSEAVLALMSVGSIPGVSRIGLRYIDEIRVPTDITDLNDWAPYIADEFVATRRVGLAGEAPKMSNGLLQFELGDSRSVAMRHGALRGRSVGDAPLKPRQPPQDGPYYLVDIDSYWAAPEGLSSLTAEEVGTEIERLHEPVRTLFEAAITDRLRDEVLRVGSRDD